MSRTLQAQRGGGDDRKKGCQGRLHGGGKSYLEERINPKKKEEKGIPAEATTKARHGDISNSVTSCISE